MDNTAQYLVEATLTFGVVLIFWLIAMLPLFYGTTWHRDLMARYWAWRKARKEKRDKDEWGMNG